MVSLNRECKPPRFNDCSFLLSVVKQVSHIAVNNLDQNGQLKRKISRPKTDAGESSQVQTGPLCSRKGSMNIGMGVKQLPRPSYADRDQEGQ